MRWHWGHRLPMYCRYQRCQEAVQPEDEGLHWCVHVQHNFLCGELEAMCIRYHINSKSCVWVNAALSLKVWWLCQAVTGNSRGCTSGNVCTCRLHVTGVSICIVCCHPCVLCSEVTGFAIWAVVRSLCLPNAHSAAGQFDLHTVLLFMHALPRHIQES